MVPHVWMLPFISFQRPGWRILRNESSIDVSLDSLLSRRSFLKVNTTLNQIRNHRHASQIKEETSIAAVDRSLVSLFLMPLWLFIRIVPLVIQQSSCNVETLTMERFSAGLPCWNLSGSDRDHGWDNDDKLWDTRRWQVPEYQSMVMTFSSRGTDRCCSWARWIVLSFFAARTRDTPLIPREANQRLERYSSYKLLVNEISAEEKEISTAKRIILQKLEREMLTLTMAALDSIT